MSPDITFALSLIMKMAVTAAFVVAATVTAERAGPLVGGLVATLSLGAGPVYVFLALDHGAPFIAQSAVNSLAINNVNVIFALTYALLAQTALADSEPLAQSAAVVRAGLGRACGALERVVGGAHQCRRARDLHHAGAALAPRGDPAGAHLLV